MKKNRLYQFLNSPLYISIFLFIILVYIALWPYYGYEEGLWTYIGRIWNRNGILPYIGVVENKTPGVFFLYTISDYLFQENTLFTRFLGVLAVVFTSNILFLIAKRLHNRISGIFCMYIFGLSMGWIFFDGFAFAQTETFMVLFSTMSFYFLVCAKGDNKTKLYVFLAGITIGLAIAFKQIALTTLFALILFYIIFTAEKLNIKQKVSDLVLLLCGVIISSSITYLILFLNGVPFQDYIEGAWLVLLNPGSGAPDFKTHLNNFMATFLSSRMTCFYPFLLLFFLQKINLRSKYFKVLLIWLFFDFIGVNASGYYYGHQLKQLLPSLTIISSIVLSNIVNEQHYKLELKKYSVRFIMALIILFFPYEQTIRGTNLLINDFTPVYEEVASWIRSETQETDYVYLIGGDHNLIVSLSLSNRLSSSRYFHSIFINGEKERQIVHKDLMTKPPKFILREENDTISIKKYGKRVEALVEKNYISFKTIDNVEILKRR